MTGRDIHKYPVEIGQIRAMDIDGLGHAGEGVGRIDGFAIFVAGAIPGDQVLVRIEEIKKNHGRGSVIEVKQASPGRILPACVAADTCGGCQLQHMEYGAQLEWKRQMVIDALARIGKFENPQVKPVIGMAQPYGYRNKVHYPVASAGGKLVLGFYRRSSHDLVPIESCDNAHPLCNKAMRAMVVLLNEYGISPYDETTGKGLIRHIICRVSTARDQLMIILVTNGVHIPRIEELIASMRAVLPELVTIAQNVNKKRTKVILGGETRVIWGEPYLVEELNGLEFAISPNSFFQVNSKQAAVLCQQVVDYVEAKDYTRALDCYCGTGSLALHLAHEGAHVIGIEEVREAVADAKLNAEINRQPRADFRIGRVEVKLPGILEEGPVDVAVIDPPRKGCEPEVLAAMINAEITRLVYVSCNPSSLARDLAILAGGGYVLHNVQPGDMFPHTSHVECVVLMSRVG